MEKPSFENGERHGKAVACPRCQSSNTKFCYFNNHNVNQPRHFCRDCQRYWTAGGSLRNVPVGAGKRKHKGPHAITNKIDNLPNIFCFSGTHLNQGVYTPPLDPPSVLSFKHHVAHSYGESKLSEMPTSVSQKPVGGDRKPPDTTTSQPVVSGNCGEMRASETRTFVCLPRSEKVGFSDVLKKPSQLNLGLTLSKEMDIKEKDAKLPSNSSVPHDFTTSHHVAKQDAPMCVPHDFTSSHHVAKPDARPPQHVNDRDESTGCSSVTANLGPSVLEAFAESNTPSTRAPTLPSAEQAPGVLNPLTAWGASMCPPWLWPFIMSGQSVVPPAGVPQVDPTFAAAMGAMASIPPIHPAFAAAMGAMASGGRLPQIDPNMMAALTASFLHLPHLWNPYAWGLPWNAAWNMSNTGVNAPNVINKRPVSPTQEQGCASKILKRDHSDEAAHSTGVHTVEVANAPSFPSAGYFDAFQPKADTYQLKPTGTQESEGHSDLHQHQPPHTNPAAQARSAAFQEGN